MKRRLHSDRASTELEVASEKSDCLLSHRDSFLVPGLEFGSPAFAAKLGAIDLLIFVVGLTTFSLSTSMNEGDGLGTGGAGEMDFARLCSRFPEETLALLERKDRSNFPTAADTASP